MKILSASQIREADKYTIEHEPISSIDLMERAANTITDALLDMFDLQNTRFKIFCGSGNNGGDGLVIARSLTNMQVKVETFILASESRSADCALNLERLQNMKNVFVKTIEDEKDFPGIEKDEIIIDSLFGTGLSRPIEGLPAKLVEHLNHSEAKILAVDMPSGLYSDKPNSLKDSIIKADYTLTFQFPKLSFLLCQNYQYTGEWKVLDIGLSQGFTDSVETHYFYLQKEDIRKILKPRDKISHKGIYGHALIWAGSYGKMGAAVLCANACLRTGAGLTTAYIPGCGYDIMQTSLPEVMALVDDNKKFLSNTPDTFLYTTIGIGPGIGNATATKEALKRLLKHFQRPVVIDADAINILGEDSDLLELIPPNSILTPHPKEFARLTGESKDDWERMEKATAFANEHHCIIVLKSAMTSIHLPDGRVYFNATGNPGMAKGGSGDALTGMLTAFLACGYESQEAAILGVYLHGLAGDLAATEHGQWSMTASDLIEKIGDSFSLQF